MASMADDDRWRRILKNSLKVSRLLHLLHHLLESRDMGKVASLHVLSCICAKFSKDGILCSHITYDSSLRHKQAHG